MFYKLQMIFFGNMFSEDQKWPALELFLANVEG